MRNNLTNSAFALILTLAAANAATSLITSDPAGFDDPTYGEGNWYYQSVTLNDPGLTLIGDALTPTMALSSVTFVHDERDNVTKDPIYLVVMTDTLDVNSIVAQSTNAISQLAVQGGELMTWNFNNAVLDTATEYFFAWYKDTNADGVIGAGDQPEQARFAMLGNLIAGGTGSEPGGGTIGTADGSMRIELSAVLEPSPAVLLGKGGVSLVLRRRK